MSEDYGVPDYIVRLQADIDLIKQALVLLRKNIDLTNRRLENLEDALGFKK